ncbi:conserved protein of unknown function [Methylacidimicrobium sp. AP8]|uniref:hypothetical protein n=1 Tax=Methylacidimicrobium sp. AP8 TaxID=2730359 RepID=UPI0018C15634|nr:hypothetical protein [Methylacidimicrobium sp. AP8]CAB4242551.1 conserved protein of unknown function [Methylacidimicrobium sp. AP8]
MNVPEVEEREDPQRYWKAAIAHLPPEKQQAAWEWYRSRSEAAHSFDSLSGLLLLLEANAAYLERVPKAVQELLESAANHAAGTVPFQEDWQRLLGYMDHYTTQLQELLGSSSQQWQGQLAAETSRLSALLSQMSELMQQNILQLQELLGSSSRMWQEKVGRESAQLAGLVSQITEQSRMLQKRLTSLRLWAVGLLLAIGFFAGCSTILLLRLLMPKIFGV